MMVLKMHVLRNQTPTKVLLAAFFLSNSTVLLLSKYENLMLMMGVLLYEGDAR